jgi:riboflavin kinase / FMN adenylyltransferase
MQTYRGFPLQPLSGDIYLTIGSFDGIHRGHQALIRKMATAARAAGCLSGLLTFDPPPVQVLRPDLRVARLTCDEEREAILEALGLDFLLILPFSREIAAIPADEFLQRLTGQMSLRSLWIGPDFALGRGREGDSRRLSTLGEQLGYEVRICPPYTRRGEPVRSSRVRALLTEDGAVEDAAELLGRPYQIWGSVEAGVQRGHRLGFPTANIAVPPDRLVPAYGVYACWAWLGEPGPSMSGVRGLPAVVNVGVRPTFDNGLPSVEAYLMDFEGDLYSRNLGLSFIRRLRSEKKFAGIPDLVAQIQADVRAARRILVAPPSDARAGLNPLSGAPGLVGAIPESGGTGKKQAWEELPHTADWALRVHGSSQRQLFARAASAMFTLEGADPRRPIELARALHVTAGDTPDLLVGWLNQLLLGQEIGGEIYSRFRIHEISERGLQGVAYGYRGAPLDTAVKAATYYDLDVSHAAGEWTATVTFDV